MFKSLSSESMLLEGLLAHYWTLTEQGWTDAQIFAHFDFLSSEYVAELRVYIEFYKDEQTLVLKRVA